jgi:hypothetical protein
MLGFLLGNMAKKFNPSQFRSKMSQLKSKLRQAESKQRQAISRYKQNVRELNRSIEKYNREVRAYNSRQRVNQQRLASELRRLQSQDKKRHIALRTSAQRLTQSYKTLDQVSTSYRLSPYENYFIDLAERETTNSLALINALESSGELASDATDPSLQETSITDEILNISVELDQRWRGALYSLNPRNPEAARHFCTSVREVFSGILEVQAPDTMVFEFDPNCRTTDRGNPTRREKIRYLLESKDIENEELIEFVDEDIANVIELFEVLNAGTHGHSGRYDLDTLRALKARVEDGLHFLARISA